MSIQTLPIGEIKPIAHVERYHTSAGGARYLLPSDDRERERLALQHRVLKKAFGGQLIFPSVDFARGGAILDSGTGSGIWILDAASILPSTVDLYGTDIEPNLFPELDATHHGNLHFSVNSITDLPKDWDNTFTLVNQRLLICALDEPAWQAALREIHRVLAPGGWVQLGELSSWKGGPITERHIALMWALCKANGQLLDIGLRLPSMLERAGFQDICVERRMIPLSRSAGADGIDGRKNSAAVFRAMKTPTLKAGGLGYISSEEDFDALLDAVEEEWDETPGSEWMFDYVYARKPSV